MKTCKITYVRDYQNVRTLSRNMKNNIEALQKVASMLQPFVTSKDILIPIPSHTGRATYMLDVADILRQKTGCKIMNILRCEPHESICEMKKKKDFSWPNIFSGCNPKWIPDNAILLDNVLDTGSTYFAAQLALGKLMNILVISKTKCNEEKFKKNFKFLLEKLSINQ